MISDILSSALDGVFLDHNFYVQKRTANCVWDKHQHRLYTRLSPNSSTTAGVSGHRDGKDAVVRASIRVLLSPLIRFVSPTMSSVSEYIEMTAFISQIDIPRARPVRRGQSSQG